MMKGITFRVVAIAALLMGLAVYFWQKRVGCRCDIEMDRALDPLKVEDAPPIGWWDMDISTHHLFTSSQHHQ